MNLFCYDFSDGKNQIVFWNFEEVWCTMKQVDITGEKFDFIDYSEGNIFFDTFSEGEKFIVKTWGATLMHQLRINDKDVYVAAMSELVFENVACIFIDYGIYANEEGTSFIKNLDGNSTHMHLTLGKKENLSEYTEYMIGGILGRYAGYGEITIYCKGKIQFTYDETALIDATEFCLNVEKYRFH